MVIIKPLKVLVCLAILSTLTFGAVVWAYNGTDISGGTGTPGRSFVRGPPSEVRYSTSILGRPHPRALVQPTENRRHPGSVSAI